MDWISSFFEDDRIILGLLAIVIFILALLAPIVALTMIRHKARLELDHYGKFRGSAAARSFVCPECLTRSYAPTHIEKRWCVKCQKIAPERLKIKKPKPPPWFTDDLNNGG